MIAALSVKKMDDGYLQDFEGKPILASCENCTHLTDVSDGPEYGLPWYVCDGKAHMGNLKGFPFRTPQKCCELNIGYTVDWDAEHEKEYGGKNDL